MPDLPVDIVEDVLLVLPAKSICRFRCVCKYRYKLLNDHDFMESRYKRSIEREELNCFAVKKKHNGHELRVHITKSSSLYTVFQNKHCEYVKMNSPFEDTSLYIEIIGSDNGLILMRSFENYGRIQSHWLWNLYTKVCKKIVIGRPVCSVIYGITYNCDTGDHTIMEVASGYGCKIQVYTLKSNSWRLLPNTFPYELTSICDMPEVIFVCGAFHWIARPLHRRPNKRCIVSYDVSGENFNQVAVTHRVDELLSDSNYTHKVLGVLGGCLCMLRVYVSCNIDVWVMKDYDVTESWTRLFIVGIPEVANGIMHVKLLWEFNNGEVLFVATKNSCNCCLVLYDPVSRKCQITDTQHFAIAGCKWSIEAYVERGIR